MKEIGLYIHYPFCIRKCHYCDFYSTEELSLGQRFMESLIKEIKMFAEKYSKQFRIATIFFGGGTPSLMSTVELKMVMDLLKDRFLLSDGAEVTLEANPGTIDTSKLEKYRQSGINRLSIGVQSFVAEELKFLQRIHDPAQARQAVRNAREAGFVNISIDLMFAVPGQTQKSWEKSLKQAVNLGTDHIACYSLIYEKGTPLYRDLKAGKVKIIDEESDADMFEAAHMILSDAGFDHYEVSNYARPGKKCLHNLIYWRCGEYLGFGPSANGYLEGRRFWNPASLTQYLQFTGQNKSPVEGSEILSRKDKIAEEIMLGLRSEGIDLQQFRKKYNIDFEKLVNDVFDAPKREELLNLNEGFIAIRPSKYILSDSVIKSLIIGIEDVN